MTTVAAVKSAFVVDQHRVIAGGGPCHVTARGGWSLVLMESCVTPPLHRGMSRSGRGGGFRKGRGPSRRRVGGEARAADRGSDCASAQGKDGVWWERESA
jgi:hypothetical protein